MTTSSVLEPQAVQRLAAELSARDRWKRADLLDVQRRRLDGLLAHAVSASRYYHETIGAAVRAGASLEDLPVLTKRALIDEWDRIVTDSQVRLQDVEAHLAGERRADLFLSKYLPFATGGTTGERSIVIYDHDAWMTTIANMLRWVRTMGTGPESKVVGIGAPTALHITNRAFAELRSGRGGAPHLSVLTPLPHIVEELNNYQPEVIITYPSFARRLVEEQQSGRLQIRPRRIASTAEVLAADVRKQVKETWNAPVVDSYGTTEGGLLGTECDIAQGIHIAEDVVVFEVVDEHNRRVPDGTPGSKVLVTNLFNRLLPLIRYELSDIATVETGACACGRPYARVTAIDGRREDYLTLRALGGGCIRVHAARLRAPLAGVPGLRQFQVVTTGDHVTFRLTIRGDADAEGTCSAAIGVARTALRDSGADVSVTVELVESIERAGTSAKEKLVANMSDTT